MTISNESLLILNNGSNIIDPSVFGQNLKYVVFSQTMLLIKNQYLPIYLYFLFYIPFSRYIKSKENSIFMQNYSLKIKIMESHLINVEMKHLIMSLY